MLLLLLPWDDGRNGTDSIRPRAYPIYSNNNDNGSADDDSGDDNENNSDDDDDGDDDSDDDVNVWISLVPPMMT